MGYYRRENRQWEKLVKWVAVGILIVLPIYSVLFGNLNSPSENVRYANGDYYLDHDPNIIFPIVPGVDPNTGIITCGASTGNFANCEKGKWPAYNELLVLARIVAFLSAFIVPYDFLKSKENTSTILFVAIIGAVLSFIPFPSFLSFIEGALVDAVQSAVDNDFDTPGKILKFVPAAKVIGGLAASTWAIYEAISSICHGLKTTKKRRFYS